MIEDKINALIEEPNEVDSKQVTQITCNVCWEEVTIEEIDQQAIINKAKELGFKKVTTDDSIYISVCSKCLCEFTETNEP